MAFIIYHLLIDVPRVGPLFPSRRPSHIQRSRMPRVRPNVQRQLLCRRQFPTRMVPVRVVRWPLPSISSPSKLDLAWTASQTTSCTKSYLICPPSSTAMVMKSSCWSGFLPSVCCHGLPHCCASVVLQWHGRTLRSVVPKYQMETSCSSRQWATQSRLSYAS